MRQAKAQAAAQGETLKTLLTRAVTTELGKATRALGPGGRVRLPLFGSSGRPPVNVRSEDVARVLADADAADLKQPKRRKKRRSGRERLARGRVVFTKEDALSRQDAWNAFENLIADPRIRLMTEPQGLDPLWKTLSKRNDTSHLLWTDDYLAAFAQAADADMVTLDRGLSKRYGSVRITCLS